MKVIAAATVPTVVDVRSPLTRSHEGAPGCRTYAATTSTTSPTRQPTTR
jgi:hypothetical protein